jgi:hypothetical protein
MTPFSDEPPAEMPDAALAAEVARLIDISNEAAGPEDDLTESGWARLYALQAEQDRRRGYGQDARERWEDDGRSYSDPREAREERYGD